MKKIIAIMLSMVLLLCTFTGCKQTEDELTTVRVNEVTHSIFYAPQYVAMEMGFFEDEGLNIELTNGGGSNVSMTAIVSGQADIGLVGPETVVFVYNQGREDYPVVFGQLTKRDGSFLFGRDDKAFDFKDLEGTEIIAGRKGGMPAMSLEYVLNQHGLYNGKNITLNYDVAFPMMAGAFEGGQGDYVTLFEPVASTFENAGKGYRKTSIGKEGGEVPFTCFVATKEYIADNEEVIESYLRALYKAIKYMKENDLTVIAESLKPQFDGTTVEEIENTLSSYLDIDAWMTDMSMTEDSFDRLQDIMVNAGVLKDLADYDKLVDNTYAEKIYTEILG